MQKTLLFFIFLAMCFSTLGQEAQVAPYERTSYIEFIENKGQWNNAFQFMAEIPGGFLYLEENQLKFQFYNTAVFQKVNKKVLHTKYHFLENPLPWHGINLMFLNANPMRWNGIYKNKGEFNFIYGQSPEKWVSNVNAYGSITAGQVYNGIDLKMYVSNETVKYDFVVAPGVNPKIIKWKYEGEESVKLQNGKIRVKTSFNVMEEVAPYAFQIINGVETQVPCNFTEENGVFGFEFPEGFHTGHRLIIDPELIFSTFSGSFSDNFGYTATYDDEGNLYSGSTAFGNEYVTTIGAYDRTFAGGTDIAITKYSDDGRSRAYSTYIGGSQDEMPHSLIVNKNNELYVFGSSESNNYPTTTGAYDPSYNVGGSYTPSGLGVNYTNGSDIIISKLSADGTQLLASTFIGGNNIDGLNTSSNKLVYNYADEVRGEIILDDNENVLIATSTKSTNIPIVGNGFQTVIGGGQDGYIAKIDKSLTNIIWSTYFGGNDDDAIYSLDTDEDNNVYITGGTVSSNLPVTSNAYQPSVNMGRASGFVAKLNANGSVLLNSTYYGKEQEYVQAYFVEANKNREIIVFGQVENATGSFLKNATFGTGNGGLFITKFNSTLSDRVWSTSFGLNNGQPAISPTAFLVDVCNKIYISGWGGGPNVSFANNNTTGTAGLPVTADAIQSSTDGNDFYLMVLEDDASAMVFASYFGGGTAEEHVDGGTSRFDKRGIIYQSVCAGCGGLDDFPIFPSDAVSPTNNSSNCNNGVFKIDFEFDQLITDFEFEPICLPDPVVFTNTTENGLTYEWDFGDGATATTENPSHIYNSAGTYEVRLISTNINTCNSRDTIIKEVTVLDNKSYNLPDLSTCKNDAIQIGISDATDDLSYLWQPANLVSDSTDANPFAFPTETQTFLLLVSNGVCTDSVFQFVEVIDPTLTVSQPEIFCEPVDSVPLFVAKENENSTVFWANDPDFNDIIAVDKDTIFIDVTENTIVYVKSINNGCEVDYQIPLIVENVEILLTQSKIICDSALYRLNGLGVGGTSGSYLYEIPYFWDITLNSFDPIDFYPDSSRWYVVTVSDAVSGCLDTDSVYIGLVDEQFEVPTDLVVCDADTIVLNASRLNSETLSMGEWFPKDLIINEPGFAQATVSPNGPTQYWFTSYDTDSICPHTDTILVTISEPKISLPDDIEICAGDTVSLTVSNVSTDGSILTYKWNSHTALLDADSLETVRVAPKQSTYFVVQATNQLGCVLYDSVLVDFPDLGLTLTPDTFICAGDTITLKANNNNGTSGLIYEWSPAGDIIDGDNADSIITISPEESTFYSLNVTSAGNCESSYGVQVVVSSDFVNPAFGKTICEGDTTRLSINTRYPSFQANIEWQPAEKIIGSNTRLFIFTSPDETTDYTYKVTVDEKCPIIDTLTVTYSKIYVAVPDFVRFCANDSVLIKAINLDSSQTLSYSWSTASEILSGASTSQLTIKPNQDTVVTLLVVNQFGCEKEFTVPVLLSEPDFELTNDTLLCIGEEIYLTAINTNPLDNFDFNWIGNGVVQPADKDSVLINPQISEYIYVTGTNQIGCVKQDSVQAVVAPDQIQLPPPATICKGDSVWIQASALYQEFPVDYLWSGHGIVREQGDSILVMPDSTTTYQVSIITSDSCIYADTYDLSVIVIDLNLTPDTLVCDGSSVELVVTNNEPTDTLSYQWNPENGVINANKYVVTPDTSTYYVVESTNKIGCKRTDTVLVALTSEYTYITNADSICFGDTVVFYANNKFEQFHADYIWTVQDTNAIVLNALNQDSLIVVPDTSMYVELITTTGLGCDPIDSSQVFVSKIYIELPDSLVLCAGDTAVVHLRNLNAAQNLTYNWMFDGLIIGDNTRDSVMFVPTTDSYLSLITTNELGCSRYDEVPFSVTSIDYTMTGNILLCPGDQGVLEVENNNTNHILTYEWTPAYGMLSNNDLNQITVQPDSTTRYFVSMTNQHGCTTVDSADAVLTNDMIEVTPDTVVCAGDLVTLKATNLYPEFVVSYDWSPSSEIIGAANESDIVISLFQDQTYQVVINNQLGCSYSESIDVTVSRVSLETFTAYAEEDSVAYGATPNIWVEPNNSNYNYHWEPAELALYPDSFETPVTLYETTRMTGSVTDGYCLKDFDVLIYVSDLICDEPNIFIPNAFTPNNDGENDMLFLRGNNILEIDLKVYDRWGELVFESNDQSKGWDGEYKGVSLDPAVFVYHLKVRCENNLSYFKKGNVTLIR